MASAKPRNCVPSSCIRPRMRGRGPEDTGQAGEVRGTYSSHSGVSTCREGDRRVRALSLVVGQVNAMCPPPQWDRPQSPAPPRGPTSPRSPHRTRSAAGMPLPRLPRALTPAPGIWAAETGRGRLSWAARGKGSAPQTPPARLPGPGPLQRGFQVSMETRSPQDVLI